MIREIDGQTWFCCPECGKKLHVVARGARGVFVWCRGRRADGSRCTWRGEIQYDPAWTEVQRGTITLNEYRATQGYQPLTEPVIAQGLAKAADDFDQLINQIFDGLEPQK